MKRIHLLTVLLCCLFQAAIAQTNPKPFVIPELKEWKGSTGEFTLNEQTRIVYPKNQPELQRIAQLVAADCKEMFNYTPAIVEGKAKAGDIVLSLKKDKKLGKEGYAIKIAVKKSEVPNLLPKLKSLGATDILEYELRKVLS